MVGLQQPADPDRGPELPSPDEDQRGEHNVLASLRDLRRIRQEIEQKQTVDLARGVIETGGPTALFLGAVADGEFLKRSGGTIVGDAGGGGGGDNITVNGAAVANADFDDATPAPPAGEINVKWQKDASTPANVSASVQAATTTQKGVVELATSGESAANVVVQGNDARMSDARTPLAHTHDAADVNSGVLNVARVGTGSGDSTTFLDGSGAFSSVPVPGITTKQLGSQHDSASSTGTEVTGLSTTLTAGTYTFTYYLITQAANNTVGMSLGINYTGTMTRMGAFMRYCDTGTTATTGVADDVSAAGVESIHACFTTNKESTTTPDLGPLTNHIAQDVNVLVIVEGIIVVSDGGDLELWHASDTANNTSIMVGSSLVLTKIAAAA